MRKSVQKAFIFAVGVAVIMLSVGCQEQELPSTKKSRLIAAENIQLEKELTRRDKEIEKLRKQHDKGIKQQKELLAKCLQQKEALEKQRQQGIKEQVDSVLSAVVEANAKLSEQIEILKAQIEKLKAEQEELTAKPEPLEAP